MTAGRRVGRVGARLARRWQTDRKRECDAPAHQGIMRYCHHRSGDRQHDHCAQRPPCARPGVDMGAHNRPRQRHRDARHVRAAVYSLSRRLPLVCHLQFSQIRGRQPYLIVRKILYVIARFGAASPTYLCESFCTSSCRRRPSRVSDAAGRDRGGWRVGGTPSPLHPDWR